MNEEQKCASDEALHLAAGKETFSLRSNVSFPAGSPSGGLDPDDVWGEDEAPHRSEEVSRLCAFNLWQRSTPTGTPSADQVLDSLVLGTTYNDVLSVPASAFGDYNNNGTVAAAYVMWRHGGPLANEVDAPGTVNGADYTAWRARFGNPASGAGGGSDARANTAVPEPATSVLLLFAAAGWCVRPRRKSHQLISA